MKHRSLYIPLIAVLLGLSGCHKKDLEMPESNTVKAQELVTLEHPITLSILVNPTRVSDESHLRAVGDFSKDYSQEERARATVNSPKGSKTGDRDYDDLLDSNWNVLIGLDWIRDLSIPELGKEDYKVEGLVPLPDDISDIGNHFRDPAMKDGYVAPKKVTITFYKLPTDGKLTFLANAKVFSSYRYQSEIITHLDLQNPFLVTTEPLFQLSDKVRDELLRENKDRIQNGYAPLDKTDRLGRMSSDLFYSSYLPMYTRLYNVKPSDDQSGIMGSEKENGVVRKIETLYLERAVSLVSVTYDRPTPDKPFFFNEVDFGKYPNVTSVIPNNFAALKAHMLSHTVEPFTKENPGIYRYATIEKSDFSWSENTPYDIAISKEGTSTFFVPENIADTKEHQTTIYVQLSEIDFGNKGFVGDRRKIKIHVPIGERNSNTGLLDTHRNTWYKLHLKLKAVKKVDGSITYEVVPYNRKDVDLDFGSLYDGTPIKDSKGNSIEK